MGVDHLESTGTEIMMRGPNCMPVIMRGPIVRHYDERTYCTPVMMRGPIVRQL